VAYGTETYVLGLHRTESQQKVMERENSIISLEEDKGAKYKSFDLTPDAMIAIQLQQNVNLNNAIKFAGFLQSEFKTIGRYDRGVKQAGFLVLYKTAMPSVLIETGFLTNPNEEGFIGKPENARKKSGEQFFFINNRFMRNPYLHKAIIDAYKNILPPDTVPSYFLYLEAAPDTIDVNIHPTKTEIKFEDQQAVWQIIHATVKQSLGKN
jgi:DNA mismatch repair ATPase MutL